MVVLGIPRTRIPQGAGAGRPRLRKHIRQGYPCPRPSVQWHVRVNFSLMYALERAAPEFNVPDVSATDAAPEGISVSPHRGYYIAMNTAILNVGFTDLLREYLSLIISYLFFNATNRMWPRPGTLHYNPQGLSTSPAWENRRQTRPRMHRHRTIQRRYHKATIVWWHKIG